MSLDISLEIIGYIRFVLGFFYKVVGKEGEGHLGLWSWNPGSEWKEWVIGRTLQRIKDKWDHESKLQIVFEKGVGGKRKQLTASEHYGNEFWIS